MQKLFERLYPALVRRLTGLVADQATAEDLAQEAFIRLVRHGLPRGGDPAPWLQVVATRLAYNHLRSEARRHRREQASAPAESVLADHRCEDRQAVSQALSALPWRDQVALRLHASGYSYAEIATMIHVRPSSVGSILARATQRLRARADPAVNQGARESDVKGVPTP